MITAIQTSFFTERPRSLRLVFLIFNFELLIFNSLPAFMLVNLPPRFEPATHARDVFEAVFQEISRSSQTTVPMIAINDQLAIFIRAFDEALHISVVEMKSAGNMRIP